jgi:hypothetical protein
MQRDVVVLPQTAFADERQRFAAIDEEGHVIDGLSP